MQMLKNIQLLGLVLVCFWLSSCGYLIQPRLKTGMVELKPGSYQLDAKHTNVLFKINHLGFTDYVGRFNRVDAQLEFDPEHLAEAKLSAVIDIASIDVNNPDLEETLRGSSWFDSAQYPQAVFTTTGVKPIDNNSADFIGTLSLHGVTRTFVLHVRFNGGGTDLLTGDYTLGFSASGSLLRSDYGISYLVPAIADQVNIEVFAEFQKR